MWPDVYGGEECVEAAWEGDRVAGEVARSDPGHGPRLPGVQLVAVTQRVDQLTHLEINGIHFLVFIHNMVFF